MAFPGEKRTEASEADFRKSWSEETVRYDQSPFTGAFEYKHFMWNTWKTNGCRLPSEQDVQGYD